MQRQWVLSYETFLRLGRNGEGRRAGQREEQMIRLRALLMGAALITGVSALASAQPLPQSNWAYAGRNNNQDRGRNHDRDGRAYDYYNGDRDERGYYDRGYYNQGYYGREDYDRDGRRWRDRDDRQYRDRDDRNYRNRSRDWDHDGDRR